MSMLIGDLAKQGLVYTGCTTAAGLCTGLSTTYTGLLIYNPYGSGVNLLMYDGAAVLSAVPAAIAQPMISVSGAVNQTALPAGTAAGTIFPAKTGVVPPGSSLALLRTIVTLPAVNVNYKVVPGSVQTGAVTVPHFYTKFDGSLIVSPGTGVMWSFTTTAYTAQYSFTWAEIPILPGITGF
jgi:hypothetical protein